MYEIISKETDKLISYSDKLLYICRAKSGSYIQTDKENACGIAYNSTPYNISGKEPLDTNLETVIIKEIDSGKILFELSQQIQAIENALAEKESPKED